MKDRYKQLLNASEADFISYQSLPMSVYITCEDGVVLRANRDAKGLLEILDRDLGQIDIISYYDDPEDRKRLVSELKQKANGEWIKNENISFLIRGQSIKLRFFAKVYKVDDEFVGSLCIVHQITAFEQFHKLEDNIPIGLFEVSANNKVTYSNKQFRNILGLSENETAIITNFLSPGGEDLYRNIVKKLSQDDIIVEHEVEITKKDGSTFVGNFTVVTDKKEIVNGKTRVLRTKGSLEDISFKGILNLVPIGTFTINQKKNELRINQHNNHFASIFGDIASVKNITLEKILGNPEEYKILDEQIRNLTEDASPLREFYQCVNHQGETKELIIHIKRLTSQPGRGVQYVGAIYDVTDDMEKRLLERTLDFASLLHSFSAACDSVRNTLQGVFDAHGTDAVIDVGSNVVSAKRINIDSVFKKIISHINSFKTIYIQYKLTAFERGANVGTDQVIQTHLLKIAELLKGDFPKHIVAEIRYRFIRVKRALSNDPAYSIMPKELLQTINREIIEIFRFTRLLSLDYLENEMFDMSIEIEEFKEALRSEFYTQNIKRINLVEPLRSAMQNLQEYALRKNLELKAKHPVFVEVKGDERELSRAFYNIISNAIKYSWIRPLDKLDKGLSFVSIEVKDSELKIDVSFTNRGVGIPKSEIVSGSLFKFGERGQGSSDRRRPGSGIGLWHTMQIIRRHNGFINVQSEPIHGGSFDLNRQFQTTFTITLTK